MNKQIALLVTAVVALAAFSLSACSRSGETASAPALTMTSAKLSKPVDSVDLEKRLKDELTRQYERQYAACLYGAWYGGGGVPVPADGTAVQGETGGGTPQTGSSLPYSGTNNQEEGVDEGDLVKTDGSHLYLARGSRFLILQATPADQTSVISDIDLGQPVSEVHLYGNRAVVISGVHLSYPVSIAAGPMPVRSNPTTQVRLYDVSTPASPALIATYEFPGAFQGSRRIDNRLYLVANYAIDLASPATPLDYLVSGYTGAAAHANACGLALEENRKRIEGLTLADLLPVYTRTAAGASSSTLPAVSYDDVYVPESGNGTDLSLVINLDITEQAGPASSGVFSSWCRIYMNTDSLYLASHNDWLWIQPMPGAGIPESNPEPRTAVHKFRINGADPKPVYSGSGIVDGWLNDRFSMSDYLGYLRIGTTRGGWWGESISNQLTVLAGDGDNLREMGKITGLAKTERIYSMRFDRDRGYMVTFRQTDPLFTLDLSNPAEPRVAGEIKVNGFSTYIHLVGTDKRQLLTIGPEADDEGRMTGDNKLQLFDVSDLSKPALLASENLGQGWSSALYDPHAFVYYEGLLAVPYYAFGSVSGGYAYESGLNVFDIGSSTITKRGVIAAPAVATGYGSYDDTVDRSVIIGTDIFSIAHRSITVADTGTLDVKKTILLPESYSYYLPGGMGETSGGMSAGAAGAAGAAM